MRESFKIIRSSIQAVRAHLWVFSSVDFHLGVVAGAAATITAYVHDDLVARSGRDLAIASIALGAAIVAVALTALAILASLMSELFAAVIEKLDGGIRGAIMPYQVVAVVAALGLLGGGAALVLGPLFDHWVLPIGLGVLVCLDVWMVVGTVQIVNMTAALGVNRSDLYKGIAEAKAALDERKASGSR